jgi:serine/threonine protein kinase/Tol biopolymer transport system component
MPLTQGIQVGPYVIEAPLGAGGMGEVYRARDTRLRRDVALKVLPADVSSDESRRTRFEQEALSAAALNHPNILGVHDVGTANGVMYMATELVNGETLASMIERGPVAIRTLLDIAVQIADGMACAHAAQIVHRDLKPANVMVATDGRVKILDFGLAKQTRRPVVARDETVMVDQTEPGMIVGTVSYMSPEQARGKPADYRSDQFSFGLVLYEMATGKKAFDCAESVQTMSAIIAEEPPPIDSRLPAPLRWAIDRCLAKDPSGRYESSRDLFRDLRSLRDHLSEVSSQALPVAAAPVTAPRTRRIWIPVIAFLSGAALTLAALILRSGPALPDQSAYRYSPFSFEPGGQNWAVWSPDGKAIAYSARRAATDANQVFIRYLEAPTAVQLTHGSASAFPVAWSPDSARVLLMTGGEQPAIWSVATVGGEPEPFMTLPKDLRNNQVPTTVAISPDNRTVAALVKPPNEAFHIAISSPPGSPLKKYAPDPFASKDLYNMARLRFSPDGKQILLMANAGRRSEEAWLLPYPASESPRPRRVLPDLVSYGGTPEFSWMPDSRRIVMSFQAGPDQGLQLWLADLEAGTRHALTSGTTGSRGPAVSPDGQRLIVGESSGSYDVITMDLTTAAARTLISTERDELMPAWAATDQALVYVTDRNGPHEIWLRRGDTADRPIVTSRDFPVGTTQWFMGPAISPRGDRVVYTRIETGTSARLWISALSGGPPIQLTNDTAAEAPGSWSPDGAWFVYHAVKDGRAQLMKVKTSGQASPVVLKADIGSPSVPSWSPANDWILSGQDLVSPDGKTSRSLGDRKTPHFAFSYDGKLLYGLRRDKDRQLLFSLDVATGAEKIIGETSTDFLPGSNLSPSIRLSLAPDGKSVVFGAGKFKTNLWMLEGFAKTPSLLQRLGFERR